MDDMTFDASIGSFGGINVGAGNAAASFTDFVTGSRGLTGSTGDIYREAQKVDSRPGDSYEGTSLKWWVDSAETVDRVDEAAREILRQRARAGSPPPCQSCRRFKTLALHECEMSIHVAVALDPVDPDHLLMPASKVVEIACPCPCI